jgi:arabinogalactan endo-1,4-beta-galactosidase
MKYKKKYFTILVLACLLAFPLSNFAQLPFQTDYAFGLDLSFVKQSEDRGMKYTDTDNVVKPVYQIFREHGYNWGRVMICNEPVGSRLVQDLPYVIASAKDLKTHNFKFLLDYMFSNGWANPMTQPTPSEWKPLTHKERVTAVYKYVSETMTALKNAGVMPDMVQIGNEIGNGFLWPDGRVRYDSLQFAKWENLTDYLSAGAKAIREVSANGKNVKIMLHVDFGGDIEMTKIFFDKMRKYKVDYDVIGLSFYPWSHGTLLNLRDNLMMAANEFHKEIIVVETGYYWTQSRDFKTVKPPFAETPEGQRQWFEAVNEVVMDTPNGLGKGVFWWHPMAGNRGFFDANGKVQPIIHAFEKYGLPLTRADGQARIQ